MGDYGSFTVELELVTVVFAIQLCFIVLKPIGNLQPYKNTVHKRRVTYYVSNQGGKGKQPISVFSSSDKLGRRVI